MKVTNHPKWVGLLLGSAGAVALHAPASAGVNMVDAWVHGVEIDFGRRMAEGAMGAQNFRDSRQWIACGMFAAGDGYCLATNATGSLSCSVPVGSPGLLAIERITPMTRIRFRVVGTECVDISTNTNSAQHFPEAGFHQSVDEARVDLVRRTASAGLGAARNSSDATQLAFCALSEGGNGLTWASCLVRNAAGQQLSCNTDSPAAADAVRSMGPLSMISFGAEASGRCLNLAVFNYSKLEQPR